MLIFPETPDEHDVGGIAEDSQGNLKVLWLLDELESVD